MKILDKLFGKKGTNDRLLIDAPIQITLKEAEHLKAAHERELKKIQPLQTRLREETSLLKKVLDRKLTKKERKEVYDILKTGEDPLLLAAYLKCPFKDVAIIANNVLADGTPKGQTPPRIPTDVGEYITLAKEMEKASKK